MVWLPPLPGTQKEPFTEGTGEGPVIIGTEFLRRVEESVLYKIVKFPLAPIGVLAPVSEHAGPSAQHACLQSRLQTSPPTPQKSYLKFRNSTTSLSWIFLILPDFPVKIGLIGGEGGVPEIIFWLESSSLCYLGAHAKICNPMISLSWIYSKLAHFPIKIGLKGGGVEGVPEICFPLES